MQAGINHEKITVYTKRGTSCWRWRRNRYKMPLARKSMSEQKSSNRRVWFGSREGTRFRWSSGHNCRRRDPKLSRQRDVKVRTNWPWMSERWGWSPSISDIRDQCGHQRNDGCQAHMERSRNKQFWRKQQLYIGRKGWKRRMLHGCINTMISAGWLEL